MLDMDIGEATLEELFPTLIVVDMGAGEYSVASEGFKVGIKYLFPTDDGYMVQLEIITPNPDIHMAVDILIPDDDVMTVPLAEIIRRDLTDMIKNHIKALEAFGVTS